MEQLRRDVEDLIRAARARGVKDPVKVIAEYIGNTELDEVRQYGLKVAINGTIFAPVLLYGYKLLAASLAIPFDLPEQEIIKFWQTNVNLMLVYGFGNAGLAAIKALKGVKGEKSNRDNVLALPGTGSNSKSLPGRGTEKKDP